MTAGRGKVRQGGRSVIVEQPTVIEDHRARTRCRTSLGHGAVFRTGPARGSVPRRAGWARPRHAGWARRVTGKAPPIASAGPGGARVAAAVTGLSWSAVRAGDGGGDPGDVGVIEAAQDAGEVDGDVVVAEAGGDSEDGSFGGRAAELVAVQGGDWRVPSRCRRRDARRGGCRRGCSWC